MSMIRIDFGVRFLVWNTEKFFKTLKILYCLGMARTFGKYVNSGWDGTINYARYEWRGREWIIPTGPVEGLG